MKIVWSPQARDDSWEVLRYRVRTNRIEILRIYHGARRWPEQFDNK
ncbi:MAG: hypothetical protein U1F76_26925 [Candidatus Competibacteraceae bacterium]